MSTHAYLLAVLLLLGGSPNLGQAFVSKLSFFGGPIPCHQLKAAVRYFVKGTYTGTALLNALEEKYLTPNGLEWSAPPTVPNDQTDNTNLAALLDGIAVLQIGDTADQNATELHIQRLRKLEIADDIESACAAGEHAFGPFDTMNEFRARIGIATQ